MIKGGAVARAETPATCIAKAAFGELYGWTPILAVNRIYLVDGRPCLAAEAMVGLVRERLPGAQIVKVEHTRDGCTVKGRRNADDEWHVVTFDRADADAAGLLKKNNWKNYAKSMYWARAVAQLCRELFSDITLGAHTPDEAESFTVRQLGPREAAPIEDEPIDVERLDQRPKVEPEDVPDEGPTATGTLGDGLDQRDESEGVAGFHKPKHPAHPDAEPPEDWEPGA